MQDVVSPSRDDLLHRTRHLRTPVTAVFVRVTVTIILVDPFEVAAIVLSIIGQLADLDIRARNQPLHGLRMEDNRRAILRSLVGRVDDRLGSLDSTCGDVRSNFDKEPLAPSRSFTRSLQRMSSRTSC